MRHTDSDGGVTNREDNKVQPNGGMEGQTTTVHAVNRERLMMI